MAQLRLAWWRGEWHEIGVEEIDVETSVEISMLCVFLWFLWPMSYGSCGGFLWFLSWWFLAVTGAMAIMFGGCFVHLGLGGGFLFGFWYGFDSHCGYSVWPWVWCW